MGHDPLKEGKICDPADFTGTVEVPSGILGLTKGNVIVDLVEPGREPLPELYPILQRQTFSAVPVPGSSSGLGPRLSANPATMRYVTTMFPPHRERGRNAVMDKTGKANCGYILMGSRSATSCQRKRAGCWRRVHRRKRWRLLPHRVSRCNTLDALSL